MLPRLLTVWLLVAAAGNTLDNIDTMVIGQSAGDIQISHHKYQQRVAIITLHCLAWHTQWGISYKLPQSSSMSENGQQLIEIF